MITDKKLQELIDNPKVMQEWFIQEICKGLLDLRKLLAKAAHPLG